MRLCRETPTGCFTRTWETRACQQPSIRLEADHEAISILCAPSRLPPWPARLRCIYNTTSASTIQSTNPIIAPARNFATSPRFEARSRRLDVPVHVQPRSPRCGCCRVLVQTRPSIHCSADRRIRALTRGGGVCSAAWRMCTGISLSLSHALGVHNTLAYGFEGLRTVIARRPAIFSPLTTQLHALVDTRPPRIGNKMTPMSSFAFEEFEKTAYPPLLFKTATRAWYAR